MTKELFLLKGIREKKKICSQLSRFFKQPQMKQASEYLFS